MRLQVMLGWLEHILECNSTSYSRKGCLKDIKNQQFLYLYFPRKAGWVSQFFRKQTKQMANNPTFLEQMVQKEYLNHFQTRNKWKKSPPSLKMGNLVLLKEANGTSYYLDKTT